MDNATIVALAMLTGVFVLMAITILKMGIDAAIRLWSVMGALTGVAFGSITSYYFTNKSNQAAIQQAQLEKEAAVLALNNASLKAAEASKFVGPWAAALKGEMTPNNGLSTKYLLAIPNSERAELALKADKAFTQLEDIQSLRFAIDKDKIQKNSRVRLRIE